MELSDFRSPRTPESILAAAAEYRSQNPRARARNVAEGIGISEAELVAARIGKQVETVVRLRPEFPEILMDLEGLGPVMALTRNHACVHEKTGVYRDGRMMPESMMGLFTADQIDLRLFFRSWCTAFYVVDEPRMSLQFFDSSGMAVHKIYAVEETDIQALRSLVETYASPDQEPGFVPETSNQPAVRTLDEIDTDGFVDAWHALDDTHGFYPLLHKYGISRRQAVDVATPDLAREVERTAYKDVMQQASNTDLDIMVFVGSGGCVQIHTGPVKRLVSVGPWYNVLDPGFNLHLKEEAVADCFVVVKPTCDGPVTALEAFDADGELILQLFGKRKPGIPEMQEWRRLIDSIPSAPTPQAMSA